MAERLIRVIRWGIALAILAFLVRTILRHRADLASQPIDWTFRPLPALGSVCTVWAMYALLIAVWRRILGGWGERLDSWTSARIWVLSSLGKYVPGKVWAIAGMALMARDAGVSAWAATASALIIQAMVIGTGAAVAILAGGPALELSRPGITGWVQAGGLAVLAATLTIAHPAVSRRLVRLVGAPHNAQAPGLAPLLVGIGTNFVAWFGYGIAFWLLARAVLPTPALDPTTAIAAFAASYVAGLVALFAPAGLVVREGLMIALLSSPLGLGAATALAVASRVLLTVTELGAAIPFLFHRGNPRVH